MTPQIDLHPEEWQVVPSDESEHALRRLMVAGAVIVGLAFGGAGTWLMLAPLDSAAVAMGSVVVDSHRKTVQHLEGGIVRKVLVKEGEAVTAGQLIIELEASQAKAVLAQSRNQYWTARARVARLEAEQRGAEALLWPDELGGDPTLRAILQPQEEMFRTRRDSRAANIAVREKRIIQFAEEIMGMEAQRSAARQNLANNESELASVERLLAQGYEKRPRLLQLQRTVTDLKGSLGEMSAKMARTEQEKAQAELEVITLRSQYAQEIATELQEARTQLSDLSDRLKAAEDVVARTQVKAPLDGKVVDLKVFTVGGVVAPGQPLLDIVPDEDPLLIEAQVKPTDIDVVFPGLPASIRLTAFKQRTTPPVDGVVETVSADKLVDPRSGEPYFTARIRPSPEALAQLHKVALSPGMPAEVFIATGSRRAIDYLLSPFTDTMRRAFREQ